MKFSDIQKVYCISLLRRPDRREQVNVNLKKAGIDFEFFDAVDGERLQIDRSKLTHAHPWMHNCGNGTFGVIISFAQVLQKAKEAGLSNVMIVEDDVEFKESFSTDVHAFLNDVPEDWDLIYFGGNHVDHFPIKINDNVSKCVSTRACQAIIFKDTCYDKVINEIMQFSHALDEVLAKMQRDRSITAYVSVPPLAWQYGSYSDIEYTHAHYKFLETFDESDYEADRVVKGYPIRNYSDQ
jgi:GR25 family glycosyltransferase involved in LPS biosynthesis